MYCTRRACLTSLTTLITYLTLTRLSHLKVLCPYEFNACKKNQEDINRQGATCGQRPHRNRTHREARAQNGQKHSCTVTKASWQILANKEGRNSSRHAVGNPAQVVQPDPACSSRQNLPIQTGTRLSRTSPLYKGSFVHFRQQMHSPSCVAQHKYEVARDVVHHVYRLPRLCACTVLGNV